MELIKNITEIISAITIIIGTLISINKFTKGKILNFLQRPVLDKIDSLDGRIDKLEINDLKQIIMNDNIPITERLEAGNRYILLGGNGAIKIYYKEIEKKYLKELEGKEVI